MKSASAPVLTRAVLPMAALLLSLSMTACAMENAQFDTQKWISESKKDPEENQRWAMTQDVERFVKPGMTREEVLKILGNPGSSRDTPDGVIDGYFLGVPTFSIDTASYELIYVQGVLKQMRYVQG